jgi:Spy/CpxP family protein refolding chaperone
MEADNDDPSSGVVEHHRYHHHGGVTLFLTMSLDTLGVTEERRAQLGSIRSQLRSALEPARKAEQSLETRLADEVAAGTFDVPGDEAAVAQVVAAATTLQAATADSLNRLHALLTPAERDALIDKVEAHWTIWQRANAEESTLANEEGGPLSSLTSDLSLTPQEVSKLRARLHERGIGAPGLDPEEVGRRIHAFGEAFLGATFDARALPGTGDVNARLVGLGAARMAHFVETVSPLLTPEQRTKLSQTLREHASHELAIEENQ